MNILYNKKNNKYILGNSEYAKDEFISYIESDMLESVLTNETSYLKIDDNDFDNEKTCNLDIIFKTTYHTNFPQNRILFGAPGTGKSYTLNSELEQLLGENKETDYERVTFHPDYSYANFVGTYKPVMVESSLEAISDMTEKDAVKVLSKKKDISYEYVPGPFMRVLVKALKNARTDTPRPFLLLIEEINRANVAAVFGDIFQLLDRDSDGVSEYKIATTNDMRRYLSEQLGVEESEVESIKIPNNMFIWATMNSADQGVFPMDTAFKRRWNFTYLGIDDNDDKLNGKYVLLSENKSQKVEWNKLRKAINNYLAKEKINEDKQLGPYFISKDIIIPEQGDEINRDKFIDIFKNKVIMYLFEDAARQKRSKLFEGCFQNSSRYSQICKEFDKKGIGIFNRDIIIELDNVGIENNNLDD